VQCNSLVCLPIPCLSAPLQSQHFLPTVNGRPVTLADPVVATGGGHGGLMGSESTLKPKVRFDESGPEVFEPEDIPAKLEHSCSSNNNLDTYWRRPAPAFTCPNTKQSGDQGVGLVPTLLLKEGARVDDASRSRDSTFPAYCQNRCGQLLWRFMHYMHVETPFDTDVLSLVNAFNHHAHALHACGIPGSKC
jgi:hypothetical protein